MDWLIADCTRPSFRAAAEKLPVSATVDENAKLIEGQRVEHRIYHQD